MAVFAMLVTAWKVSARVVQFMLSYGVGSYFGGMLYGAFGARRLIGGGLVCAALARILLGLYAPGAPWLAFNGPLVLLGIGVGAVIPTISSRAIGAGGLERASLVGGSRFFMCQLAGAARDAGGGHGDILRGQRLALGTFLRA